MREPAVVAVQVSGEAKLPRQEHRLTLRIERQHRYRVAVILDLAHLDQLGREQILGLGAAVNLTNSPLNQGCDMSQAGCQQKSSAHTSGASVNK